jgi:hypothetical protein
MGPILFLGQSNFMAFFIKKSTGEQVDAIQFDASQPNATETIFQWIRPQTTQHIRVHTIIASCDSKSGHVTYYELRIHCGNYSMYHGDYVFFDPMSKMIHVMPSARFEKEFTPVEESIISRAENLISRHEDGWTPTPSDWNIIREALSEGRIALDRFNKIESALKTN